MCKFTFVSVLSVHFQLEEKTEVAVNYRQEGKFVSLRNLRFCV